MNTLKIHTLESAPEASKASLEASIKGFGSIPNLHGVLASSPETLEAYKTLHKLFVNGSFNAEEITVVWQSINVEHGCHYCVPAHTAIAHSMKIDPEIIDALRNKTPLASKKLEVLRNTTLSIVRNRGQISYAELKDFYEAGYDQRQLLEILLGIAQKTISNYTNRIAETPIDEPFQKFEWKESGELV